MSGRVRFLLAALLIAGLAMRMQLVSIGPLLPLMRSDLNASFAFGGLLVTLPVLCMGLVAIPATWVADRFGGVKAIAACLFVLAAAGLVRAVAPGAGWIVLATVPIGLAIGLGGVLLPVVAKERLAWLPALATGAYVIGFVVGSTLASSLAVPLAETFDTWRAPLAIFGLLTAATTLTWWLAMRGGPDHERRPTRWRAVPWRRPMAWLLVVVFGSQSLLFFGVATWLPSAYVEEGMGLSDAGLLVGILIGIGLPVTAVISWTGDRYGSRRGYLVAAFGLTLVSIVGIILVPGPVLMWTILAGIGMGISFPVALTMPLDISAHAEQVAGYVGLMLGVGYIMAATAPLALGAVRDLSDGFSLGFWLLALVTLIGLAAALAASPTRLARERARNEASGSATPTSARTSS